MTKQCPKCERLYADGIACPECSFELEEKETPYAVIRKGDSFPDGETVILSRCETVDEAEDFALSLLLDEDEDYYAVDLEVRKIR